MKDDDAFWAGVAERRLLIQACGDCGTLRHPPVPMCGQCGSLAATYRDSPGHGYVLSWIRSHHGSQTADSRLVVLVGLDEGIRMVSNLADVTDDGPYEELRVVVDFRDHDGTLLPVFRPAGTEVLA